MKLLIVGEDFKPNSGGVAELTHLYGKGFCEKDSEVLVVACKEAKGEEFDEKQKYDVERLCKGKEKGGLERHRSKKKKIKAIAKNFKPDFLLINYVGIHVGHLPLAAGATARSLGIPFGILAHGMEFLEKKLVPRILRTWTATGASVILASSRFTAGQVRRDPFIFSDVSVVNPGIDISEAVNSMSRRLEKESGMSEGFTVGTLSRLVKRKGHTSVIKAISRVSKKYPDVRYLIAGTGKYKSNLRKLVEENDVKENVYFMGRIREKDKYPFMKLCDIFAMPSKKVGSSVEGFGIVFIEAAACGTPSIATDSGGISDAVDFGKTGVKVDPDSPIQIANAIIKMIENEKLVNEMGDRAKKRVQSKFEYGRMVSEAKQNIKNSIDG